MWPRLIIAGFMTAVGLSLFVSVLITPIAAKCARFYGGLGLLVLVASCPFFFKGLEELADKRRRYYRKN